MSDLLSFPNSGIQNADGSLNQAGHSMLAEVVKRVALKPAGSAEEFLVGGKALVQSRALFGAVTPVETTGGGSWQPDLGSRLWFKRTISGPLTILFPANVPAEDAEPCFGVWITQDSVGGWSVDFGPGFEGQAPPVLTNPGDRTLLGFNITGPATFTAWSVKGIQA